MKFDDFTQKERNIIAEFVYGYDYDILIKAEAHLLVNLFVEKKLIDSNHAEDLRTHIDIDGFVLDEMIEILFTSIDEKEGKKIMDEYFSNLYKND